MNGSDEPLAALAGRIRALADELADLALDRLLEATERHPEDPGLAVAEERRLTRAARALERAAAALLDAAGDVD